MGKKSQKAIIAMLSDNETVPSKIKINDIKAFNKTQKSHALQTLINYCKEMDQRLVRKADFIKTRNAIECSICHKSVITKSDLTKDGYCAACLKKIVQEKRIKERAALLLSQWKQLEKDLKKFNRAYIFLEDNIERTIPGDQTKDDKNLIVFSICREAIYRGSTWHATGYALKIRSNKYGIEASRNKKDFNSKNVAKSLHNKIEKIVEEYKTELQREERQKSEKVKLIKAIMKELNVSADAIENYYVYLKGRNHPGTFSPTRKKVNFGNLQLLVNYSNDKLVYHIKGISIFLTLDQVKKISKVTNKST